MSSALDDEVNESWVKEGAISQELQQSLSTKVVAKLDQK